MISLCVCDDDLEFAFAMEKMIERYFEASGAEYQVDVFADGKSFLKRAQSHVDIVFMDVMLEQESGVDVSTELRKRSVLNDTIIIYVSSVEQYTKALIQTRPTEYLQKPVRFAEVKRVLDECLARVEKRPPTITVVYNRNKLSIRVQDILYVESKGRICRVVMKTQSVQCYAKLADLKQAIGDSAFIEIHKSFLVNFAHVGRYVYEEVELDNGEVLPISQTRRKAVRESYLYLTQGEV